MESRKAMQFFGLAFCLVLVFSEIYSSPVYGPDDYEAAVAGPAGGMREVLEELERQGGLSGPMVPRSFGHNLMRKSQRSSALRLRFGKRSGEPNMAWKGAEEE